MKIEKGNTLDKRSDVLSNPDSKIGDFEYMNFTMDEIKLELLKMFSPETQRTCRVSDIYFMDDRYDGLIISLRVEKRYNDTKGKNTS